MAKGFYLLALILIYYYLINIFYVRKPSLSKIAIFVEAIIYLSFEDDKAINSNIILVSNGKEQIFFQ